MARLWVLFPICIGLSLVIVGVEGLYEPGSISFGIYDWGPRLVGSNDWVYCSFIPSGLLITGYFLVGMSALKDNPLARIFKKIVLYIFGFLFLGIGIAGYFLPMLPGTIFLILSAVCFMRSNEKMYRWVTEHRLFGRHVKQFMETGAMPKRAKFISIGCIWFFSAISTSPITPYGWQFKAIVISLAVIGTLYILTRPNSK